MSKVYEVITDRIIELLQKGTVPWHQPWTSATAPKNLVSSKEYRGINTFTLGSAGYSSAYWLSFKQTQDRGGRVKKGEHGWPCVYWHWVRNKGGGKGEDEDEESDAGPSSRKVGFIRYYTVFNVKQTEGIEYPEPQSSDKTFTPLEECQKIVAGMPNPPRISHEHSKAFYRPLQDLLGMPKPAEFDRPEDYYSVLFHELTHSTGHASRLARKGIMDRSAFGGNDYSKEELVAEMGAAYLSGHCGIESKVLDNSASYIANWLSNLRNDSKLVVQAASQAQKASDYILGRKWEENGKNENATEEVIKGENTLRGFPA